MRKRAARSFNFFSEKYAYLRNAKSHRWWWIKLIQCIPIFFSGGKFRLLTRLTREIARRKDNLYRWNRINLAVNHLRAFAHYEWDYIFLTFDLYLAHICAKLYGANAENVCILRNSRVHNFPIVYKLLSRRFHLSMNVYRYYLHKLCARLVPFASKAILENRKLLHFEYNFTLSIPFI